MIEILATVLWVSFASYAAWYLVKAKDYAPLSHEEARMLWKIHKKDSRCKSTKWRKILFKGKIVGFECGCGHKYIQKRPIALRVPNPRKLEAYKGRVR
ncbi:MAG: hypothetical protein RMJ15_05655 [Nitrososphaerota archaeon]|nr:hypothetical protein [Candidatus Bathyarchaeota archaeon]MDW8023201.1 hypothetical protein [Nitrososphaerota archaeon]